MKTGYVCGNPACRARLGRRDMAAGGVCPKCCVQDIRLEDEVDPLPRRGSSARVTRLDDVRALRLLPCDAPLVRALGGVEENALIVVSGEPGEGKSTEAARVAVALNEAPAYLDSEMSDARCLRVLLDAGASSAFIKRTARITDAPWEEALALAQNRTLWIVDSVSEWVGQEDESAFAKALVDAAAEGRIILAIQQWSRQGRARGTLKVEHRGDVTVDVLPDFFRVRKARWGEKGEYPRPRIPRAQLS